MSDSDLKENKEYDPEEEDDNENEKPSKKTKFKNDENLDNQEEEYNSQEDENYIQEEKPKKGKNKLLTKKRNRQKKKKNKKDKLGAGIFFEREAEEEENDEESQYEGELTKKQQEEEMEKAMKQTSNRFKKITDQNEEEIMEHFEGLAEINRDNMDEEEINKRPTNADPKIWIVKCRIGEEKEILENLYHKYFFFKEKNKENKSKEKVKIFSIVAFENLKGKIFIEAFTERDVQFAIQDMSNVNQNSIQLVPINERPQIFEYDQAAKTEIFKNQLVRIKGGNYDGDLAKVVFIEDPMTKIFVALVPRIIDDLKGKKGYNVASFIKQKSFLKPRQKLFNQSYLSNDDLNRLKKSNEPYGEVKKFGNFKFSEEGLLIKALKRYNLETENISPKEDELQKIGCIIDENGVYKDKSSGDTLAVANKTNVKFKKGDFVKIIDENDPNLNGLKAKVVETENGENIQLEIIDIGHSKEIFSLPKNRLVLDKHNFKNGNLVYAKYGANKGRSGMVIKVMENNSVIVYDDITKAKFEAKNSDLVFIEDMELDNEENEMFKIGELVQIKNSNDICYIIESTKFVIKVVTITNEVQKINVRDANPIPLGKKRSCVDGKGNPLELDNTVKVINGQYKGNKGVIKSIYKKFVFLLNYDFTRTNGIFCEIDVNLELLGSELLLDTSDKGRVNHRRIPNNIKDLMKKTVHVIKGNWKGYNGILLDGNDKNVRLELIAKQKIVELPFNYIVEGDINSVRDKNESVSFNNPSYMKTPAYYTHRDMWE